MSAPLLDVRDLRLDLDVDGTTYTVLRGVDLSLERGEVLGLVGESGSGKSMTARTLVRLLPDNARVAGEVLLDGANLLELRGRALRDVQARRIAMIFQDPRASINPVWRCGEQIAEVLRTNRGLDRGAARRRALELLERVGIADPVRVLQAFPMELSGGMLQRIMIAMALASDPDVLIADEATTSLDVTIQAEIVALLDELRRERGLALVFITHDLDLAAVICDRIAVMYAGAIVEQQPTDALFESPAHPYTTGLLAARPQLEGTQGRLAAIPGRPPALDAVPTGCSFHPRCPLAIDECVATAPALRAIAPERWTACHRAETLIPDHGTVLRELT